MPKSIRRVVTRHDADGKAAVIFDSAAPHVQHQEDFAVHVNELWVTAATPADNTGRAEAAVGLTSIEPPAGGSVFRVLEFAPLAGDPRGVVSPELARQHPFAHRTDTIDYQIVLEGEIDMLMDDSVVHLKTGDVVVQRGTNHAWINRGSVPCLIAAVQIDAKPL